MVTMDYNATESFEGDNIDRMDGVAFDIRVNTESGTGVFIEGFSFRVSSAFAITDPMPNLQIYFALNRRSHTSAWKDRRNWYLEYEIPTPEIVPGEVFDLSLDLNYWVYDGDRQGVRIEFWSPTGHWTSNNNRPAVFKVPRDSVVAANTNIAVDGTFVAPGEVQILAGDAIEFTAGAGFIRGRAFEGGLCYSEPPIDFDPQYGCMRSDLAGGANKIYPSFANDHGVMFDVGVFNGHAIEVVEVMVELGPDAATTDAEGEVDGIQFLIFVTSDGGSFQGRESDPSAWTQVASRTLYGTNGDYPAIRFETPIRIEDGSSQGIYITADDTVPDLAALHTGSYYSNSNHTLLGSDTHFGDSGSLEIHGGVGFSDVFVPKANREFRGQICFKSDAVMPPTPSPTATPEPAQETTAEANMSPTSENTNHNPVDDNTDASTNDGARVIGMPVWAGALTIVLIVLGACFLVGAGVYLAIRIRRRKQDQYSNFEDPYVNARHISEPELVVSTKRPYFGPRTSVQHQMMNENNL